MTLYDGKKHAAGVSYLARQIAKAMDLPFHVIEEIGQAGFYHDVGKERISRAILDKPGKLTDEEFAQMKEHTRIGFQMLKDRKLQKLAALSALEHHERMNGSGYMGYKGENISLVGRIVAVADVYDALRTVRPYRPAWEIGRIVSYMVSEKGKGFDPAVIAALLYCLEHKRGLKQTLIH